ASTAYTRYSGHQYLVGADYQFESGFRIGGFGGAGRLDANIGKRSSQADAKTTSLGLYAGQRWSSGLGVWAGYVHSEYDTDVTRNIRFADFSDGTRADFDATTQQAFIEGGYLFGSDKFQVEPYLQYAHVRVKNDAYSERGGLAALGIASSTGKLDVATGGLRASLNLKGSQQEATWFSLRGGLAYRHISGDHVPFANAQLTGSQSFLVQGAPLAKKATVAELGIAARTSPRTLLEVGYNGQFADEGNDHGASARFTIKF
ncbi:autotransporter outer membrane beta-barrel domain-containing protein, partial [Lysobacteraceae bacterium NML120232]